MVPRHPRAPSPKPPRPSHPSSAPTKTANTKSPVLSPRISARSSLYAHEADDERSSSTDMESDSSRSGGGASGLRPRAPQYPDEDTRLTSTKELRGFYSYGFAAEVFVVCGIGSFIPITLEQLAREVGFLQSDHTQPCPSTFGSDKKSEGGSHSSFLSTRAPDTDQCLVKFLGHDVNTASFAMYTFSFSVLLQAVVIVSMSGAADHGKYRKMLLLIFAFTGAVATMLIFPLTPQVFVLGAVFATIANCCFGASFVLLNSFLPLLVRYHPSVQWDAQQDSNAAPSGDDLLHDTTNDDNDSHELENSTSGLLNTRPTTTNRSFAQQKAASAELALSTRISSYGIGIGYIAAVFVQALSIVIILKTGGQLFSLKLVLFIVGLWWLAFTIPSAMWLRPRPGPPLVSHLSSSWVQYITHAWLSLGRTFIRARKLKDLCLFLAAWFLLSDGIATVSGTAVLFAKNTLHMPPAALALINVITILSGICGAFGWSTLSRTFNLSATQTILACIVIFECIPLYGLLGYIPFIRNWGVLGLQQWWEMYPLGAVYGFVLGGLGSYCRAVYGEMVPKGSEAQFFALYAITDKGSSVFGPAVVGAITDRTGEIRPAFWFLAVLIGLPFPLMWMVDVPRGKREADALADEIAGESTAKIHDGVARRSGEGVDDERVGLMGAFDGEDDEEGHGHVD